MNHPSRKFDSDKFFERHQFISFVLAFCLGLVVCLIINSLSAKRTTHGQIVAPVTAGVMALADNLRYQTESFNLVGGSSIHFRQSGCLPLTRNWLRNRVRLGELPVVSTLISLGIRLQI